MIYSKGNGNCETKQVHWDDQSQLHHLLTSVFVGRRLVKVLLPPVFEFCMHDYWMKIPLGTGFDTHTHTQSPRVSKPIGCWWNGRVPARFLAKSLPIVPSFASAIPPWHYLVPSTGFITTLIYIQKLASTGLALSPLWSTSRNLPPPVYATWWKALRLVSAAELGRNVTTPLLAGHTDSC